MTTRSDWNCLYQIPTLSAFPELHATIAEDLFREFPFDSGRWQQLDIAGSEAHFTRELTNLTIAMPMAHHPEYLKTSVRPDLPWAENHFLERVNGDPINPGVEHANWPYHANGADLHISYTSPKDGSTVVGKYSHNYMERFWPKGLDWGGNHTNDGDPLGYRFRIGDLNDVVNQLRDNIHTRQAFLPIFFPEDTGAQDGQRVPCTLGYQFIVRENLLHLTYFLRSCEIYRHFKNDVYMAIRLAQWVCAHLNHDPAGMLTKRSYDQPVMPGQLTMHVTSMHSFVGDDQHVQDIIEKGWQA